MKNIYTLVAVAALLFTQLHSYGQKWSSNGIVSNAGGIASAKSPICVGSKAILTLSVFNGNIQWQDSTAGIGFIDIASASVAVYETPLLYTNKWFRAKVTQGNTVAYSNKLEIVVASPPVGSIAGPNGASEPCIDATSGYTLKITTNSLMTTLVLYKDNEPQTSTITQNGNNFEIKDLKKVGIYTVKAHVANLPQCISDLSGSFIISPAVFPSIFTISGGMSGCEDSTKSADIRLSGSTVGVEYTLSPIDLTKAGTGGALVFPMAALQENNGIYIIKGINSSTDCRTEMTGHALIDIKPSVGQPVITAQTQYCNTASDKLIGEASNASQYTWSVIPAAAGIIMNDQITWNINYSGAATLKLEASNASCSNIVVKTTMFTTEIQSPPKVSKIWGDSLVCKNDIRIYKVDEQKGISYNWDIDMNVIPKKDNQIGVIEITYLEDVPKNGARLTVTPISVTCGLGQPKTLLIKQDIDCSLSGISAGKEVESATIEIFPNPTSSQINVRTTMENIKELSIADPSGRILFSENLFPSGKLIQANVSELAVGLYIITLKGSNTVLVTKFYKQ